MTQRILVDRPEYIDLLKNHMNSPFIKVLTGVRRCGKSTLLELFSNWLDANGVPSKNIFFYKMDQFGMPIEPTADWLMDQIKAAIAHSSAEHQKFILLDEIQEVVGWEKAVRQLCSRDDIQVFITGSNAKVLSSDLTTLLAGRYVETKVYPLSFKEFLAFNRANGIQQEMQHSFQQYVTYGGMPSLFGLSSRSESEISEVLSAMFDTVLINDVARYSKISDFDLLNKLIKYIFSTSGNLFSTKKIADALTSAGRKTRPETIDSYIDALERAFVLFECGQAGVAGKQILRPLKKLYSVDTGLRNLPERFSGSNLGFQLENVVFVELLRRGFNVSVGTLKSGEIDFVASKGAERQYIQVSLSLLDDRVFDREIGPLLSIADSFPKTILTLDGWRSGITPEGVNICQITEWLTD